VFHQTALPELLTSGIGPMFSKTTLPFPKLSKQYDAGSGGNNQMEGGFGIETYPYGILLDSSRNNNLYKQTQGQQDTNNTRLSVVLLNQFNRTEGDPLKELLIQRFLSNIMQNVLSDTTTLPIDPLCFSFPQDVLDLLQKYSVDVKALMSAVNLMKSVFNNPEYSIQKEVDNEIGTEWIIVNFIINLSIEVALSKFDLLIEKWIENTIDTERMLIRFNYNFI
jgi:hypothetical protein